MNISVMTLVVAALALIVSVATLIVTYKMFKYTRITDAAKKRKVEEDRRRAVLNRIQVKEAQLRSLNDYSWFPRDQFTSANIETQKILLESEIDELRNQL